MSVELPRDAEGREIPLDTVALFNRVGNLYSIVRWTFTTDFDRGGSGSVITFIQTMSPTAATITTLMP